MRRLALAVALVLLASGPAAARDLTKPIGIIELQAAFLYNFTQFVDWPEGAQPDADEPFVIGVLGADPFGSVLDAVIAGERVGTHPIVVRRCADVAAARSCHMLFVGQDGEALARTLKALRDLPVLTVGNNAGFAESGGVIELALRDDRIRIRVNRDAAAHARLGVSSKLLRVADVVEGKGP